MYSPKIQPDQVNELYRLKVSLLTIGERVAMTDLVKEALNDYIPRKQKDVVKRGGGILLVGEALQKDE